VSLAALVLQAEFPLAFELLMIFAAAIAVLVFLGVLIGVKRERHQYQENASRQPSWQRNVMGWFLALALLAALLIMAVLIIWSIAREIGNTRSISNSTQNTGVSRQGSNYWQQA
jgi:NADH:ubiquinone oxidoreductase subunit 6 (subunit J)